MFSFLILSTEIFAYNFYAPNSWETVDPKSWHYQALYQMCRENKAPSYTEDFFSRGMLTRYEMASLLKDILENKEQSGFDEESKKTLDKLKKEYSRELHVLGWKEEKNKDRNEPIVEIGGDARIRWRKGEGTDARVRAGGRWNVGENTYIEGGGSTDMDF